MVNENLLAIFPIVAAKKPERDRMQDAAFFNLIPGSPGNKAAYAAIGLTTVARQGLKREAKVAEATAVAVTQAIVGAVPIEAAITAQPALRDLDRVKLAAHLGQVVAPILPIYAAGAGASTTGTQGGTVTAASAAAATAVTAPTPAPDPAAVYALAGDMVQKALGKQKTKTFTAAEARKYKAFLDQLPAATQAKLIKN